MPDDTTTFQKAKAVEHKTGAFEMHLSDGVVTFQMIEHFAEPALARAVLDPYLESWEVSAALSYGRREIRFEYEGADVIDRDPPGPGQPQVVRASAVLVGVGALTARLTADRLEYPAPPRTFVLSPDARTLWDRYERYQYGGEPLQAMAYACATFFNGLKRQPTAPNYAVSDKIISKMRRLATERGDATSARKFGPQLAPLLPAEKTWLESAVRLLVRRVGESATAGPLGNLTMADLPALPSSQV